MHCWRTGFCLWVLLTGLATSGAGTLAQFRTPYGDLEVELYDQQKPVTVANFKKLVQSGAYQNTFFHRLVPGFVAQGGGYFTSSKSLNVNFGPPWSYVGSVSHFGAITNEYNVGPHLSNTNKTIAMAKLGTDPNSATCEWFFNLTNNSANLDNQNGGFTVFGHVVRDTGPANLGGLMGFLYSRNYATGMVDLASFYPTDSVATSLFRNLPVVFTNGYYAPWYSELFYVDISLLSVLVTKTNNQKQISWNSINGKTNIVEYTTNMPPSWKTLVSTNGNGSRITVTDSTATNAFRFYRVRVAYP